MLPCNKKMIYNAQTITDNKIYTGADVIRLALELFIFLWGNGVIDWDLYPSGYINYCLQYNGNILLFLGNEDQLPTEGSIKLGIVPRGLNLDQCGQLIFYDLEYLNQVVLMQNNSN